MYAGREGHASMAGAIIDARAALDLKDSKGWTALMHAGDDSMARNLLGARAGLDLQYNRGRTALMHAEREGHASSIDARAAFDLKTARVSTVLGQSRSWT